MAIKATQFDLTKKDQDDLLAEGKKATEEYLRTYNKDWHNFVPNY
jgi:hypothetical protein